MLPWNICMLLQQHYDIVFVSSKRQKKIWGFLSERWAPHTKRLNLQFYYWLHFLYICQLLQTTNKQHVQFMRFFLLLLLRCASHISNVIKSDVGAATAIATAAVFAFVVWMVFFVVCSASNIVWYSIYRVTLLAKGRISIRYTDGNRIKMKISKSICNSLDDSNPFFCDWFALNSRPGNQAVRLNFSSSTHSSLSNARY